MDKAIEQVFKVFSHLAREIQVYVFSGFVVLVNALIIDHFYYKSSLLNILTINKLEIPTIIATYLIGQFCMAFYYVILELPKFDKKLNSFFSFKYEVDSKSLPKIYSKDPELYNHFIERYVILTMMRWTISSACFINLTINIIILFNKSFQWQILLATIIFAVGTITFYLLTTRTENDYSDRINSLKND